jgi:hypothetical protein
MMFLTVSGAGLIVAGSAFFWYLLPRRGQVNRLVQNAAVGSMVTIAIMSVLTLGVCMLFEGLFG